MHIVAIVAGLLLIVTVLGDAFATIVLPRRVSQRLGPSRLLFLGGWRAWTWLARRLTPAVGREGVGRQGEFLGLFGPLALLALVGLWAAGLIAGFALMLWGERLPVAGASDQGFGSMLYLSGTTFFTVGFGDLTPASGLGRAVAVVEGGTGFAFLAVVIGYLPTIFAAAAKREATITLLDARAGSPPTAVALLGRADGDLAAIESQLRDWETWAAELLETHLSYPILAFFRSQHARQSWLAALVVMLDVSALTQLGLACGGRRLPQRQARLTFAMARHVAGDLCQVLNAPPRPLAADRLPPTAFARLGRLLAAGGYCLDASEDGARRLAAMRQLYEPYVEALAVHLALTLPPWMPEPDAADDWQTTAWQQEPHDVVRAIEAAAVVD
ncbi:MAG TPA: potassium channel family protein [Thermomicrobiales bacterium]|nr:potassium channel family protein [Thermomicrobiales bacterium]